MKKKIERMPEEVVKVMSGDAPLDERLLLGPDIKKLQEEKLTTFYSSIIYYLTGLVMDEEEAWKDWADILKHKYLMSEKLARNVGIRVAALDYFTNIRKVMDTVTFIDVDILRETQIEAVYDKLTRLYNRRSFEDLAPEELEKAQKGKNVFSLAMLDIDDFKNFNDSYGHLAGDTLLFEIAKQLKKHLRDESLLFRYGGEEFMLLFQGRSKASVKEKLDLLKEELNAVEFFGFKKVTFSVGIAEFPCDASGIKELIACADQALYQAKRSGKNRVYLFKSPCHT
ncbi:MAG TPA: diguanylate cyclase [bacterium]|nr:diguanylate cyclase [bacterium]